MHPILFLDGGRPCLLVPRPPALPFLEAGVTAALVLVVCFGACVAALALLGSWLAENAAPEYKLAEYWVRCDRCRRNTYAGTGEKARQLVRDIQSCPNCYSRLRGK